MQEPNTVNLQRQQYKIPKLYIIPMIDCFLVLTIFLVIVSGRFTPIRAIPIYQTHGHGGIGWRHGKVFVKIDNPTNRNAEGAMYIRASGHSEPVPVQYGEMLSLLQKLPEEHKTTLLIYAGEQVYHEQIVRVLDIGIKAGIGKVGFPAGSRGAGLPFIRVVKPPSNQPIISE